MCSATKSRVAVLFCTHVFTAAVRNICCREERDFCFALNTCCKLAHKIFGASFLPWRDEGLKRACLNNCCWVLIFSNKAGRRRRGETALGQMQCKALDNKFHPAGLLVSSHTPLKRIKKVGILRKDFNLYYTGENNARRHIYIAAIS